MIWIAICSSYLKYCEQFEGEGASSFLIGGGLEFDGDAWKLHTHTLSTIIPN